MNNFVQDGKYISILQYLITNDKNITILKKFNYSSLDEIKTIEFLSSLPDTTQEKNLLINLFYFAIDEIVDFYNVLFQEENFLNTNKNKITFILSNGYRIMLFSTFIEKYLSLDKKADIPLIVQTIINFANNYKKENENIERFFVYNTHTLLTEDIKSSYSYSIFAINTLENVLKYFPKMKKQIYNIYSYFLHKKQKYFLLKETVTNKKKNLFTQDEKVNSFYNKSFQVSLFQKIPVFYVKNKANTYYYIICKMIFDKSFMEPLKEKFDFFRNKTIYSLIIYSYLHEENIETKKAKRKKFFQDIMLKHLSGKNTETFLSMVDNNYDEMFFKLIQDINIKNIKLKEQVIIDIIQKQYTNLIIDIEKNNKDIDSSILEKYKIEFYNIYKKIILKMQDDFTLNGESNYEKEKDELFKILQKAFKKTFDTIKES